MKFVYFVLIVLLVYCIPTNIAKTKNKNVIDNIVDIKDFKKLIRTKTNVLICFTSSLKESASVIKIFNEVAESIKGQGTMVLIDCSGEAKKTCKKLKVNPQPTLLKHYKDGDFHKDYDRKETFSSMLNFMRDPSGDVPWEEDTTATEVVHITDAVNLARLIRKESKPLMVMFYAPWCGFCKTLKPDYAEAAKDLQGHSVLAAIDVNRPENNVIRTHYNITGFPTLLYYLNGQMKFQYEGENNRKAIVAFMHDPKEAPAKLKEPEWSDTDSDVVHLSTSSFDPVIKEEASALIMFYAPWCGHCKKMKPEYEKAANILKNDGIPGMLAAVDATKEPNLASRFSVKGYPSVKYYSYGELKFDVNVRESSKIVDFMRDPKEPPPPPPPEKPWSDEQTDVVHLTEESFKAFLKKKKHVLVEFYAPWCGHCKRAKPEFEKAASHFKNDAKVEFAAVDCTTQQALCSFNEITGYPTIKYFSYYTKQSKTYTGGRTASEFITFMTDPDNSKPISQPGAGDVRKNAHVLELNSENFKAKIASHSPTLVMFYTTWCSHCTSFKPIFFEAAKEIVGDNLGKLALYDCTQDTEVTDLYDITGFPTLKLFRDGKFVKNYVEDRNVAAIKAFFKGLSSKDEL